MRWRVQQLERDKLEIIAAHNHEVSGLQAVVTGVRAELERGEVERQSLEYQLALKRVLQLEQRLSEMEVSLHAREQDQHALQQEVDEAERLAQIANTQNHRLTQEAQQLHTLLEDKEGAELTGKLHVLQGREEESRRQEEVERERRRAGDKRREGGREEESRGQEEALESAAAVARSGQQEALSDLQLLRSQFREVERAINTTHTVQDLLCASEKLDEENQVLRILISDQRQHAQHLLVGCEPPQGNFTWAELCDAITQQVDRLTLGLSNANDKLSVCVHELQRSRECVSLLGDNKRQREEQRLSCCQRRCSSLTSDLGEAQGALDGEHRAGAGLLAACALLAGVLREYRRRCVSLRHQKGALLLQLRGGREEARLRQLREAVGRLASLESAAHSSLSRLLGALLHQSDEVGHVTAFEGCEADTKGLSLASRLGCGLARLQASPQQSSRGVVERLQQYFLVFSQRLHSTEVERRALRLEVANQQKTAKGHQDLVKRRDILVHLLRTSENTFRQVRDTLVQWRCSVQPLPLQPEVTRGHMELSRAESMLGGSDIAVCQTMLCTVSELVQAAFSRIGWLEQEVTAGQGHMTTLRSEPQDACLGDNLADVSQSRIVSSRHHYMLSAPGEEEEQRRDEEVQRRDGEVQRRDEEVQRRDGEVQRRDEEVQRREGEVQRREGEVQRREGRDQSL
ncbi:hypothetical protein NHX12_014329 [Muraenolepis orangiensis]|uniref:Coiled-coil domain-containing protein 171 n=1 Tax=Muraenolepis orangiensis TaxID=630683 RepID=A0A9Q0I537_9TELE|nr:hypothetical protein NHX12_014329 [Muraenolepis orangiensis]